jgi:hypothetical protein
VREFEFLDVKKEAVDRTITEESEPFINTI